MKRKIISIALLLTISVCSIFVFTACNEELYYGTFKSTGYFYSEKDYTSENIISDNRDIILTLAEKSAVFGTADDTKAYSVNYSSKRIGINTDSMGCYWGTFIFEFKVHDTDTLFLKGYLADDNVYLENGKGDNAASSGELKGDTIFIIFSKEK